MKKILLTLLLSLVTFSAFTTVMMEGGIKFTLNKYTYNAVVAGNYLYKKTNLIIPSEVSKDGIDYKVTAIGSEAFVYCNYLVSVDIPSSVTSIGRSAFVSCNCLVSVNIPSSVTSIGDGAFSTFATMRALKEVNYNTAEPIKCASNIFDQKVYEDATLNVAVEGVEKAKMTSPWMHFRHIKGIGTDEIVLEYDNLVFRLFKPESGSPYAEVIGNHPTQKTELIIPSKVSKDGVDYPVKYICPHAFYNCAYLSSVTIPEPVMTIGDRAFENCTSLVSVDIPSSVMTIGDRAFENCTSLVSVDIPSSVTSIGELAFDGCSSLVSVDIPSSVTSIGELAFYRCSSLVSVDIPSSVKTIGEKAFLSQNIREVNYNTKEPIGAAKNVFLDEVYANATLNVAVGGLENAKRTSPWMYFNDIREIEFSGVDSPVAESCSDGPVAIYDINGIYVGDSEQQLAPGMYVVRKGDKARIVYVK